jgi:hypothetical protein
MSSKGVKKKPSEKEELKRSLNLKKVKNPRICRKWFISKSTEKRLVIKAKLQLQHQL